ncbi:MAG: zinc-binding alcohol dehydrogenase [Oscillospiraceae bacterium]|nr:zinc-binding alcohol dehydrogenase [Oscillospiraceae bacterium]
MNKNYRVCFTARSQVELQECPVPEVGDDQLLVKLEISQISTGTELTYLEGNVGEGSAWEKDIVFPRLPGYSAVGRVIAVGKNVDPGLIGKRLGTSFKHQMYQVLDAERLSISHNIIPDNVPSADAVFGTISGITMASIRSAQVRPGDVCVVYGAGLIGQLTARNAKNAGAATVIVADVSDMRLGLIPKEPSYITVNSAKVDMPEFVKAHTKGDGADIVFETTSHPGLIEQQLHCLRPKGKLIITSSPKGKSTVDFDYCSRFALTIIGAHNVTYHTKVETLADRWTSRNDKAYFLEMCSKNAIDVSGLTTHTYSYKDAVSAYEMLMKDRTQALSVILNWEE